MRKITFLVSLLLGSLAVFAGENCRVQDEIPLRLMSAELGRSIKTLKKLNPPVYYLSYTYEDKQALELEAAQGGLTSESTRQTALVVSARAGSIKMDNTRPLKGNDNDDPVFTKTIKGVDPLDKNPAAFRLALWRATQQMAEAAQEDFSRVQTNSRTASTRQDNSDDFVVPPVSRYCHTQELQTFDTEKIGQLLLKASRLVRGNKFVQDSSFSFSLEQGHRYFANSSGTQLKTPFLFVRLDYNLTNQLPDGAELARGNSYDVVEESQLPTEEQFLADVRRSLEELEALSKAPEAEPLSTPTILKNRAMAVFVHEVLGHRLEGHRQKLDSFGKTFTSKIGQSVTAPFVTVVDDATLAYFGKQPLRGFYEYDDEGVKAVPVTLLQEGVLRGFLMSSSPIENFPVSNGHGRAALGKFPVARMGNTRLIASQTVSYEELEQQLLAQIRQQHKPYGYIIEDLSGGFTMINAASPQVFKLTPNLVYRIYPDGKKEVVRGADIVGTPLVSFGQILAAADDDAVFNGSCGAESGWVPVSAIAPSVLLRTLEIEKTAKSEKKPPILPSPYSLQAGGKTK